MPRRLRRWVAVLGGGLLLVVLPVQAAAAQPLADGSIGQTPPALSWIGLQDSRGISMWNYELSLDRGGLTSPGKFFWASITDSCWGAYRSGVALALWFLDWVLSMSWLHVVAAPLLAVGTAMQQVVSRLGLVPTFLTVTALLAGLWMLKGRYTTAVWELGVACVIAALASGVFAQPVQMVAGPNGWIVKASQTGQELAAALAGGGTAGESPDRLRQAQTGHLVDVFIRQPTEMINFGRVLDGGRCEGAYNDALKGGPYGTDSTIRDRVGECDPALGDYAAGPSASMALGAVVFMPAALVILLLALVLSGSVIAAAVWAMFQALKAIVTLVTGLLPGSARGSLMLSAAETLVALLVIVFTSVFLSVFLLVVQAMFASAGADATAKTFVLVDVLLVVGVAVYWRQRQQLRAASGRLARWMAQRPSGGATRLPDRQPALGVAPAAGAVRAASRIAQTRMLRRAIQHPAAPAAAAGPTVVDARRQAVIFMGGAGAADGPTVVPAQTARTHPGGSAASRPELTAGPAAATGRPAGDPDSPPAPAADQSGGGGLGRVAGRRAAGTLVRAGTRAVLAYATGGASTAVSGTAKAATVAGAARRAALTRRLALAAGPGPTATAAGRTLPAGPTAGGGPGRPGRQPDPPTGRPSNPARPAAASPVEPAATPRPAGRAAAPSAGENVAGRQAAGRPPRPGRPTAPVMPPAVAAAGGQGRTGRAVPPPPGTPTPASASAAANADRVAQLRARLAVRQRSGRRAS